MSETIQAVIIIDNATKERLRPLPKGGHLEWGKAVKGPDPIDPGETTQAYIASGREASMSGTEGSVAWYFENAAGEKVGLLFIFFNAPYMGDNSAWPLIVPEPNLYTASQQGPLKSGSCVVTFTIEPA